jgi:hypothetical protein
MTYLSPEEEVKALRLSWDRLKEASEKLAAFKDFVHKTLDDAGVPADPPGPHRDAGCRIGQRLAWVFAERESRTDRAVAAACAAYDDSVERDGDPARAMRAALVAAASAVP